MQEFLVREEGLWIQTGCGNLAGY